MTTTAEPAKPAPDASPAPFLIRCPRCHPSAAPDARSLPITRTLPVLRGRRVRRVHGAPFTGGKLVSGTLMGGGLDHQISTMNGEINAPGSQVAVIRSRPPDTTPRPYRTDPRPTLKALRKVRRSDLNLIGNVP